MSAMDAALDAKGTKGTKVIVGWLLASIVLAFGVVGCGAAIHHDPVARVSDGLLSGCTMSNGEQGTQYDTLCLQSPPAGWTGPKK